MAVDDALARVGASGLLLGIREAVSVGVGVVEGALVPELDVVGHAVAVAVDPERARAEGELVVGRNPVAVDVVSVQGAPEQGLVARVHARLAGLGGLIEGRDVGPLELVEAVRIEVCDFWRGTRAKKT